MSSGYVYVAPTRAGRAAAVTQGQLRIGFIHPDLGIGGAERLVVDAAVGLQRLGHSVELFTSHHDERRSFEETRDGTLVVHQLGGCWPARILGAFALPCAIVRQLHLTVALLSALFLYRLTSLPLLGALFRLFLVPADRPYAGAHDWSIRRTQRPYDVFVVDQLSVCVPLLRWVGGTRVVFYCHFPDQLLSPHNTNGSIIGSLYRRPFDLLEQTTTGEADKILVNSQFTSDVFMKTFEDLRRRPRVVYPGIEVGKSTVVVDAKDKWLVTKSPPTLLSINRFEPKKDVALAVEAFGLARAEHKNLRLVIAGGYDPRLASNVETLTVLQELATDLSLSFYTYSTSAFATSAVAKLSTTTISSVPPASPPQILFLLNITQSQKSLLLGDKSTLALLYTPSNEHFGIVPLEGMLASLPVIATTSGGPLETVVDAGLSSPTTTGILAVPSAKTWASAIVDLVELPPARRQAIGAAGRARVIEQFSAEKMSREIATACTDAIAYTDSIYTETGTLKLAAFVSIGAFCGTCGFVAFLAGLEW